MNQVRFSKALGVLASSGVEKMIKLWGGIYQVFYLIYIFMVVFLANQEMPVLVLLRYLGNARQLPEIVQTFRYFF